MIITRTPFRVSFFGGGTDYHTWYQEHGGSVLSTTINHYCYLTCRHLPPFFPEKFRIVWSRIEQVAEVEEIAHPAVRAILEFMRVENGVEIHHSGDLPARSGLGSSSSFTVGLLHAMHALSGAMVSKRELACEAVHVERTLLGESVGVQDQIAASFGGFNRITILPNGEFMVDPIILPQARLEELQSHCLLFFTGVSRTASNIAAEQMSAMSRGDKTQELTTMRKMVDEAVDILCSEEDISAFGRLLHESWQLKRRLGKSVAPEFVDAIYARARDAGAIGGKLLGAGGGGFMMFFAAPDAHPRIMEALKELLWVPFEFEVGGSSVIYFDPITYSRMSLARRDFHHLRQMEAQNAARGASDVLAFKKDTAPRLRLTKV